MVETSATLLKKRELAPGVFELTLRCEHFETPRPGQFLNLSAGAGFSLKRPLGVIGADEGERTVTCAFRTCGKGTETFAAWEPGQRTELTFPLGNGFAFPDGAKEIAVVGGGVGVFPLLSLFGKKDVRFTSFLGYADAARAFYLEDFRKHSVETFVATDDGSLGEKGFVTELLARELEKRSFDLVLACGPKGMFVALKGVLKGRIPCQASTEERMGCGVGACLVCACKVKEGGEIRKKRVCKDGPVFDLESLEL